MWKCRPVCRAPAGLQRLHTLTAQASGTRRCCETYSGLPCCKHRDPYRREEGIQPRHVLATDRLCLNISTSCGMCKLPGKGGGLDDVRVQGS